MDGPRADRSPPAAGAHRRRRSRDPVRRTAAPYREWLSGHRSTRWGGSAARRPGGSAGARRPRRPDAGNGRTLVRSGAANGASARAAAELELPPRAVEHAQHGHQRPKLAEYDRPYFLVMYAAEAAAPSAITYHGVAIFVAQNAIATVHKGETAASRRSRSASAMA